MLAYSAAQLAAPAVHEVLAGHRLEAAQRGEPDVASLPSSAAIETLIDTAFWASLLREEGHTPKISLAFLTAAEAHQPLVFQQPLPLRPGVLTKVAPAVERPGVHLGVASDGNGLSVWGVTRHLPTYCCVVEVIEPGLIVVKHRRGEPLAKFANVAVLEGDQIRLVDEAASRLPDCPALLSSLLGCFPADWTGEMNVLIQLAVSMRAHRRGGLLLVVPAETTAWRSSLVHPMLYEAATPFADLAALVATPPAVRQEAWRDELGRAVDVLAGLTAVDGATVLASDYRLLAFGAKIARRRGSPQVDQVTVTEPIRGGLATIVHPSHLGGTRHLSAAQFVQDQPDALALVASQDGRFTIFSWAPAERMVHAHRVETLLL